MEKCPCIVGLDVGTSSLKVSLADSSGKIVEMMTFGYDVREIRPGVVPLSRYEKAVRVALEGIASRYEIMAIGVTTAMYSICQETSDGLVAWQWNGLYPRKKEKEPSFADALARSGCPVDVLYGGYKLYSSEPEERKKYLLYGIKEYIIQMLTGNLVSDYTTASASGLFDHRTHDWNRSFLEQSGCDVSGLPEILNHNEVAGKLKKEIFSGAGSNTLVIPAMGDGPSASYASRNVSSFCGNIGTSMACRVFTEAPDLTKSNSMWIYAVDDKTSYVIGGISSSGGNVLQWAENYGLNVLETDSLTERRDDCSPLLFLPWINGERMPYWSSDLKGTLLGLQADTTKEDIILAIKKGVAFTQAVMVRELEPYRKAGERLIMAGGGMHSEVIRQVLGGSVHENIVILKEQDYLASIGAAMSAGEAIGILVQPTNEIDQEIICTSKYEQEFLEWKSVSDWIARFYSEKY